jgi:uncharacterized membrane protein YhiD involved in acid resistance
VGWIAAGLALFGLVLLVLTVLVVANRLSHLDRAVGRLRSRAKQAGQLQQHAVELAERTQHLQEHVTRLTERLATPREVSPNGRHASGARPARR